MKGARQLSQNVVRKETCGPRGRINVHHGGKYKCQTESRRGRDSCPNPLVSPICY